MRSRIDTLQRLKFDLIGALECMDCLSLASRYYEYALKAKTVIRVEY